MGVARILMQLDKQGETSEATIPEGAVFGHFVKAIAGLKGHTSRNTTRVRRNRGKVERADRREYRRRRRSRSWSPGPRRERPARSDRHHRGDSGYDYECRDERFERPPRARRPTRPMVSPRRSPVRDMSGSGWFSSDVRVSRDYPPPFIRDNIEGSGWSTS